MIRIMLVLPFFLFALSSEAQLKLGQYFKDNKYNLSSFFIAGAMDGTVEILRHDYRTFKRVFPKANDQFWDPQKSWHNKWKDGERANGEKFLGSSTVFVWTTDGYHLLRSTEKFFIVTGVALKFACNEQVFQQKWWYYILDFVAHSLAYTAGFNLSYELVFRH